MGTTIAMDRSGGEDITNFLRFNVAVRQKAEEQRDLANFNYELAFEKQDDEDLRINSKIAMDGSSEDALHISGSNIRKGPSVGNIENLTFENGQFSATVNGKIHNIKNYNMDKSLRRITDNNLLEKFIESDGKIIITQLVNPESHENDFKLSEGGGLKGGILPLVGAVAARVVIQVGTKELAKMAAKKAAKEAAKAATKKAAAKVGAAVAGGTIKGCHEYNKSAKKKK